MKIHAYWKPLPANVATGAGGSEAVTAGGDGAGGGLDPNAVPTVMGGAIGNAGAIGCGADPAEGVYDTVAVICCPDDPRPKMARCQLSCESASPAAGIKAIPSFVSPDDQRSMKGPRSNTIVDAPAVEMIFADD